MLTVGKTAQVALAVALPTSIILLYWWYKHNSSDEKAYGKRKVVTSRNTIIEVAVPQRAVGAIIGRQGANIKQLQECTGAQMHFKNRKDEKTTETEDNAHRIVVIRGTAESAHQAELMIHQIVAELPEILTEEIEVPRYTIGRLIGKGGMTIRDIQQSSGARLQINDDQHSQDVSQPRVVRLVGSRQQIDKALEIIEEKLEEEEAFRAKVSMSAANRDHRNKNKEQKPHIKISSVQRDDELWEKPAEPLPYKQDQLPLKADFFEVYVSAIEHPQHFWVQMVGTKALQLEQLQNDISSFVSSDDAKLNYRVSEIIPGELVAARYELDDTTYYRAKVLGEVENGKVDLYFVDFGDNTYAHKNDIFKLRSDFTSFPCQAIECQLANVSSSGEKWTDEEITCFEDLTYCAQWKSLFAKVVSYSSTSEGQKIPVVKLVDTSGAQDVDIGQELVRRGFAITRDALTKDSSAASKGSQAASPSNSLEAEFLESLQAKPV